MAQFRHFRMLLTNQNGIHEEMKSLLISGNACYHLVQMPCHLLSKNMKIKVHRIAFTSPVKDVKIKITELQFCPLCYMGVKLGLSY
jgi:hypothetical protein